ncbi:cytochrome d ubiquinol oxidase subunit II [Cobetia sp. 1CM21F]|uniref:cytochrome d ubiquinol oxidase subunit II n=1 Tax=Cobetia sp. 1CM21F TaxID=2929163 RepID=UPI0020BD491F|nr:cytochrome d ubiquinol oxidase subunit II [Cobetia sp. 1CM21F]MCK8067988.1 cytochrome d ubiquinol oxidase subunit II [Cobetia sp. 1CM21F]
MWDYEILKLFWWVAVGLLLIGFVITDGMDMGAAMLMPLVSRNDSERRVVINTLAPHWDGNQVWLVTAIGAVFAVWPVVYGAVFSSFYFAMLTILFSLFFRPLGFDYRSKLENTQWRGWWDRGIVAGSLIPTAFFGLIFGNLLQGVPLEVDQFMRASYAGSYLGLFNPFALLCAALSVVMVMLHGGTWLVARADEAVAARSARLVQPLGLLTLGLFALGGLWVWLSGMGYSIDQMGDTASALKLLDKQVGPGSWLDVYAREPLTLLAPLSAVVGVLAAMVLSARRKGGAAFTASSVGVGGVVATAGISMFPFIVPSSRMSEASLTLWDSVSSELTLSIVTVAGLVMVPTIILYTSWCYVKMWRRVTVAHIEQDGHSLY